jgi:hypothetical protein
MLSWDSGFILKPNKTRLNKTRYCQPCLEQFPRGLIKVPKNVKSLHLHVITSIYVLFRQG